MLLLTRRNAQVVPLFVRELVAAGDRRPFVAEATHPGQTVVAYDTTQRPTRLDDLAVASLLQADGRVQGAEEDAEVAVAFGFVQKIPNVRLLHCFVHRLVIQEIRQSHLVVANAVAEGHVLRDRMTLVCEEAGGPFASGPWIDEVGPSAPRAQDSQKS